MSLILWLITTSFFCIIHYTRFYSSTRRTSLWWFHQLLQLQFQIYTFKLFLHLWSLHTQTHTHTHTHTHFVTNHHMKKCMSLIFVWIATRIFFHNSRILQTPPINQQEGIGPQVTANNFCYVQFRFSGNPLFRWVIRVWNPNKDACSPPQNALFLSPLLLRSRCSPPPPTTQLQQVRLRDSLSLSISYFFFCCNYKDRLFSIFLSSSCFLKYKNSALFFKWTSLVPHLLSYGGLHWEIFLLSFFPFAGSIFLLTEIFYRFLVSAGS
jgi:hypothetical protein